MQPTNPLENTNTKDIKNRIVFMNFPSYKIRNSQYEFYKIHLHFRNSSSKRKIFTQFLVRIQVLNKNVVAPNHQNCYNKNM